jgi:hypothetical protein
MNEIYDPKTNISVFVLIDLNINSCFVLQETRQAIRAAYKKVKYYLQGPYRL